MARPPIRPHLTSAAALLRKDGHTAEADAVDQVLAPGGWDRLRREQAPGESPSNLALMMGDTVREHIRHAVAGANDDLADLAREGLKAYVEGRFDPNPPPVNIGSTKVALNVPLDPEWRRLATEKIKEETGPRGKRPSLSRVVTAWILAKYPMPASADAGEAWADRNTPHWDEFIALVREAGEDGTTVAAALRSFTAGHPGVTPPPTATIQRWFAGHPNIVKPSRGRFVWSDAPAE
ncbi:hypothetical protein [Streptomyces sp. NRRL F-5135]|uniref:hypothetical protein n=1 Tax=Streptomyces sp. NRRL F-5135 TaxID=1463858 RepID=UPI0004CC7276|nr:hypothetical protein [Streptomyces sp. NRRL F-5135]